MTTDLSHLLAEKNFENLTASEQEKVLSEMSEQDYSDQREMVMVAKLMMAKEAATLQAPVIPLAAGKVMRQKKVGVFAIFTHKVPTWAAVAAAIILFALFNYSSIFNASAINNSAVITSQIDTVFVEKVITEFRDLKPLQEQMRPTRIQKRTTENVAGINPPPASIKNQDGTSNQNESLAYSDQMLNAERVNYTALLQNQSTSSGISLKNDSITQMVNRTVY